MVALKVGAGRGDHSEQVPHAHSYFHLGEPSFLGSVPTSLLFTFPLPSPTFPGQPPSPSQRPPSTPPGAERSEWLQVVLLATTASLLRELSALSFYVLLPPLVPLTQAVAQLSAKLIWLNVTLLRNASRRLALSACLTLLAVSGNTLAQPQPPHHSLQAHSSPLWRPRPPLPRAVMLVLPGLHLLSMLGPWLTSHCIWPTFIVLF